MGNENLVNGMNCNFENRSGNILSYSSAKRPCRKWHENTYQSRQFYSVQSTYKSLSSTNDTLLRSLLAINLSVAVQLLL